MNIPTVRTVYDFINGIAPFEKQESYDNSGFLVGGFDNPVKRISVCLDVTVSAVEEAMEKQADLIISHHPIIFKPISAVHSDSSLYKLVQSGIAHIAAHTNFDVADGGLSDAMLDMLKLPKSRDALTPDGFGRISEFAVPVTAEGLAKICKNTFNCGAVRYVKGTGRIKTVAVCTGAGCGDLIHAINKKCDAYITGDVKHSSFVAAENANIALIDAGHLHTEIIFCGIIAKKLKAKFPDIDVYISEKAVDIAVV